MKIHFFKDRNNKEYCLDVNTSTIFEIDKKMKNTLINNLEDNELNNFRKNGFFLQNNKKEQLLKEITGNIDLLSISLMVSNSCNMNCIYCFNDGGELPEDSNKAMDFQTAKKAVDYLMENSNNNRGIDFFGGEPLLNFDLIKQIVNYCNSLGKFQYSMITNGTVLNTKIMEFLQKNNFHVVVSYDSILQETQRPVNNSIFDSNIVKMNLIILKQNLPRSEISIRTILTSKTIPYIREIIQEAKDLDIRILFGLATLPSDDLLNVSKKDYNLFLDIIEKELFLNWDKGNVDQFTGITSIPNLILQLMTGKQKYYSCGLGYDQVGISATGKIYPCHRFIGINGTEIGDLDNGIDQEIYRKYALKFVDNIEECSNCWAKYFCGGGCSHESYIYEKNIFQPSRNRCDFIKREINFALSLFAEAFTNKSNNLEKIRRIYKTC